MKYISFLFAFAITSAWAQPQWAQNPTREPGFYTGIGVGDSVSMAKLDARNQIASSVQSTHTFAINQVIQTNGNDGSVNTSSSSNSSVKNVLLPEIKWSHIESHDGLYYVMGKAKKSDLVALYERTLSTLLTDYSGQISSNNLTLNDYVKLLGAREEFLLAAQHASIIHDDSSRGEFLYSQLLSLLEKTSHYGNQMCVKVVYKGSSTFEQKIFEPMVEGAFSSSGMVVSSAGNCEQVTLNVSTEASKSNGQRTDSINLFVELGSPVVISKSVSFKGQSSGSKKASFQNAADRFGQHFHQGNPLMGYLLDSSLSSLQIQ